MIDKYREIEDIHEPRRFLRFIVLVSGFAAFSGWVVVNILIYLYLPKIQEIVFSSENDILITLDPTLFIFSSFLISLFVVGNLVAYIFKFIPGMREAYIWSDQRSRYGSLISLVKENLIVQIFIIWVPFIVLTFISIFTFSMRIRLNESGVYLTKYFSFFEKSYTWNDLEYIRINYNETYSKRNGNGLSLHMNIKVKGIEEIDIWDGGGMDSTNAEESKKIISYAKKNSLKELSWAKFDGDLIDITNRDMAKEKQKYLDVSRFLESLSN